MKRSRLALREITLSYSLPKVTISKAGMTERTSICNRQYTCSTLQAMTVYHPNRHSQLFMVAVS